MTNLLKLVLAMILGYLICFSMNIQPAHSFDAQLGTATIRSIMAATIAGSHLGTDEKANSFTIEWAYRQADRMLNSQGRH